MTNENIKILAIETSCDETAAAVITYSCHPRPDRGSNIVDSRLRGNDSPVVLSNIISSQVDLHAKTGGVVPEVASRAHMEAMIPVIKEALMTANPKSQILNSKQIINSKSKKLGANSLKLEADVLKDITHVAVTAGPGLIGSLLVGFNTAKALAYSLDLPIIPINHIEGHVYSALAEQFPISNDQFPMISLTVSGGHTSLTLVKDHGVYENLGSTLDDAAGEAFDKVAKLLELGYPGGPAVSRYAAAYREKNPKSQILKSKQILNSKSEIQNNRTIEQSNNGAIVFPRPILNDGTFNFSFSGLKTAVLTEVIKLRTMDYKLPTEEICAAFEDAAVDVLTTKTMRAVLKYKPKGVILAGGVSANRRLQEELARKMNEYNEKLEETDQINFYLPPRDMTGDNAAMIGLAAYFHISKGDVKLWNEIEIDSNMKLQNDKHHTLERAWC